MKKSIFTVMCFLTLILFVSDVFAQEENIPLLTTPNKISVSKLYGHIGTASDISFNNKNLDFNLGLNLMLSNKWGAAIGYDTYWAEARNMPADYFGVIPGIMSLFGAFADHSKAYSMRVVREIPTEDKRIRFGLESGVSLVRNDYTVFTPKSYENGWEELVDILGVGNYRSKRVTDTAVGLSLRSKVEFPLTRFVGLELALNTNINRLKPYTKLEANFTFGLVREKIKN